MMNTKPPVTEPALIQARSKFRNMRVEFPRSSKDEFSDKSGIKRAVVCIDNSMQGQILLRHTKAVAEGLGLPLNILHVMESANAEHGPSDPIHWQIKYQEAKDHLLRIVNEENEDLTIHDHFILNGIAGDEISRWANDHDGSLMAMTSRCGLSSGTMRHGYLGETAQKLLETSTSSLLLVPPDVPASASVHYKRLMVPLDGSQRAESVLPIAMRIARKHDAELVLAHVVSEPEIVETGPHDKEAYDLMTHMLRYNEQNAHAYLDRLQSRLNNGTVAIRTIVENDGDPRERLITLASAQDVDLILISAHGRTGMPNACCGNIARHLVSNSHIPLLMVRQQAASRPDHPEMSTDALGRRIFSDWAH
jgi:nucleotide-binding universal stress UspA family protein